MDEVLPNDDRIQLRNRSSYTADVRVRDEPGGQGARIPQHQEQRR